MKSNEPKPSKNVVIQDITKWVRQLELYFEKNTVAHILLKAGVFIFSFLAALSDAKNIAGEFWSPLASRILLMSIIIMLLIVDFGHVRIAKNRAKEVARNKRLVSNMTNIIRDASDLNSPGYNIKDWYIEHDIASNGDVNYKRVMRVAYINDTVYWVRIPISVIDGDSEDNVDDLKIDITNPTDGGALPYAVIDETDRKKDLAVMLEPPARPTQDSYLRLRLVWKGAYVPLVRNFIDHGKITVQHYSSKITMKFIAPQGYVWTGIRMINNLGKFAITEQDDGRSILAWEGMDLTRGEYTYSLVCKRKES